MIRAVFDTNVLIAGIISPAGAPASLLRSWRLGEFDLVVCPILMVELPRALGYPKLRRYLSEAQSARVLESVARAALDVGDPREVPPVSRDPADDYLFALAREFADVLVSGDRDILDAAEPNVRVLSPGGFREILRTHRS